MVHGTVLQNGRKKISQVHSNWRAGASQPSRATGPNFLYNISTGPVTGRNVLISKYTTNEIEKLRPSAGYHTFIPPVNAFMQAVNPFMQAIKAFMQAQPSLCRLGSQHVHAGCQRVHAGCQRVMQTASSGFVSHELDRSRSPTMVNILLVRILT